MRRKIENVSYLHCYFLISFCSFLLQRAEVFGKCLACAHKFRMSAVPEHWLRHAPITNDFPEHDGNRYPVQFSSVTQSCLTLCNSMNRQHSRLPCPSPTPRVYSNTCPSSLWCHPAISSSAIPFSSCSPFSSCPQSLPASRSFPMGQLFAWGAQSTGVSALTSVLPMNTQDWSL